jgi:hypothetical protein
MKYPYLAAAIIIVTYWVSLVVLHMRSNNVNVAATINSAYIYI